MALAIPATPDFGSADNTVNFYDVLSRQLNISSSTILSSALDMPATMSRSITITCLDRDSRGTWQRDDMLSQRCNPSDAKLGRGYVLAPCNCSQRIDNGKVVFEVLYSYDEE